MTNHDQKNIIQEQMQANKRIIKAASSMSGQYATRTPLTERMKRFVGHDTSAIKAAPRPPKSK